ncbi:hypothetical protein [Luxibacter massiliensis]|uniref:hypothetical protein n=1 Tax=Luxibacter massiliensis TaxID=2219695 RepID=UPI000F05D6C8|nr:hypothetical protein [Luxibacter massiliensis]
MNESEERRRQLLRQTRMLYDEDRTPAVHPRYGHIYHDLYGNDNTQPSQNSFFFRLSIGILCFICYVWMDYGKIDVANVSSSQIVNQIEKQMNLEELKAVWKNL